MSSITNVNINMTHSKYILVWFLCLLGIISLQTVHADTLAKVFSEGVLRIGVSVYEPWVMKDKDGQLYGYEIQVAEQLANDLGVKAEFHAVEWGDLISALSENKIDIIISGMAITPQRALQVNFSQPYGHFGIDLAANIENTKDISALEGLNSPEITIGVVEGSVSEKIAKKVFDKASTKLFKNIEEVNQEILDGEIDVLLEGSPAPKFLALQHPDKVDAPLSKPLLNYKTGMAVNKGEQEFLNYLNAWITARDAEDWLPSKHKYWFDSLEWKSD